MMICSKQTIHTLKIASSCKLVNFNKLPRLVCFLNSLIRRGHVNEKEKYLPSLKGEHRLVHGADAGGPPFCCVSLRGEAVCDLFQLIETYPSAEATEQATNHHSGHLAWPITCFRWMDRAFDHHSPGHSTIRSAVMNTVTGSALLPIVVMTTMTTTAVS